MACSSWSTFWSAGRLPGTSSRMSEITGTCVPDRPADDREHRGRPRSTRPGAAIEIARARRPTARPGCRRCDAELASADGAARSGAGERPSDVAQARPGRASSPEPTAAGSSESAASPAVSASAKAIAIPSTSSRREAADHRDRREQQDAGTRPRSQGRRRDHRAPAAAASTAARGGEEPAREPPRRSAPGTGSRSRPTSPIRTGSTAIDAIVSEPPTSDEQAERDPGGAERDRQRQEAQRRAGTPARG